MCPPNTSTAKSPAASVRANHVPHITEITMADTTT